ncbi:HAD-IA family hydrolase [Streptomyces sp. G-G2]|uniref:HAD family hydrolase n=1 Tax=Streptomyces sp. G-G2 TaxID=3046201 RepID=UPI0024BB5413|nr:HAD-IA family hydrolase [Streptomyces sp. G-G2]MDJ0383540.1 HAD-IA family hydrolase [Streptomyces sp. G-G2]
MNVLRAVVFDTDGVLLDSAVLHAAAWKAAFDSCLGAWASGVERQRPFDADDEYRELVDGKPRYDGALAFLTARGIDLPTGAPDDDPGCGTVWAVAARKEQIFTGMLGTRGVAAFVDARPALTTLRERNIRCAAVSASRHARPLLEAAGLTGLFDVMVDGEDARRLALVGKPDPALFLEAAARLGALPAGAAVVEDAIAGVEAGRRGHFGLVIGIDRSHRGDTAGALLARGANVVLPDLADLPATLSGHRP